MQTDTALWVNCTGDLLTPDCRVVREKFACHFQTMESLAHVKATLRAGRFTSLGGYPLYFITSDGAALSFKAVREEWPQVCWSWLHMADDGWRVVGCDVNYEDAELYCAHTNDRIESAYAEPENT